MQKFTSIIGVAAPLLEDDIDTDAIFPARYLLLMERQGLGRYLFHDRRRPGANDPRGEFVLDRPGFEDAHILIAGANFGCGSSREQAVWALEGAGIRCVIAPSFGEIFYTNCFKNGLLPITLPAETVARLAALAEAGGIFQIDLSAQTITASSHPAVSFSIAEQRCQALLSGCDEIDDILFALADIEQFEAGHRRRQPWLFEDLQAASKTPVNADTGPVRS